MALLINRILADTARLPVSHFREVALPPPLHPTQFKLVSKFCNFYATICMFWEKICNSSWNPQLLSKSGGGQLHVKLAPPLYPIDFKVQSGTKILQFVSNYMHVFGKNVQIVVGPANIVENPVRKVNIIWWCYGA